MTTPEASGIHTLSADKDAHAQAQEGTASSSSSSSSSSSNSDETMKSREASSSSSAEAASGAGEFVSGEGSVELEKVDEGWVSKAWIRHRLHTFTPYHPPSL